MGRAGQDQFMMATISDPKRGRIKMFSYHGTHPSKDGAMKMGKSRKLAESIELDEMKLTPKKMAFSLGQKAQMSGKRREPIKDNRLKALLKTVDDSKVRNAMNKEWLRGWDQQNLKDDVQEAMADRKVVSTPSLGSMNAPSSNFRMNLPPTSKMKKQMQQIMKKDASYRRKMSKLVQKSNFIWIIWL